MQTLLQLTNHERLVLNVPAKLDVQARTERPSKHSSAWSRLGAVVYLGFGGAVGANCKGDVEE